MEIAPDGHLDLWARGHYKSTILTFGKTIQDILATHGEGRIGDRELTFGIFSHTRPIAKAFLRQIKREFEGNKLLIELFPDVCWDNPQRDAPSWSEDGGIILRRQSNPKEGTVEAWGLVDGQPTSKHFGVLIYDDVVTQGSVSTPEMTNKTTEALQLSTNLGVKNAKQRYIGTRYHAADTYRVLLGSSGLIPRVYPATVDGTADGDTVLLSREELEKKRRDQGPYIFACQMLQNPLADSVQGFKREWVQHYDEVYPEELNKYIVCDPANGKRATNDYTSMWCLGLGSDKNIYVLDVLRDRLNLTERARVLMDWHRKYKPMARGGVRYERYSMQADIEHIKSVQAQENYRFEIQEVGGSMPKIDRIKRLLPYFEQGRVWFPRSLYYTNYENKTADLVRAFLEEEYSSFPVSMHDDMLDALARIVEPDLPLVWPKEKTKEVRDYQSRAAPQEISFMDF